jgi:hypothetical protein
MAVTLVVYRFDETPKVDDTLFYLGHIPAFADVPIVGNVYESPSLDHYPYYNVLRIEDELLEDNNLYVLFVLNPDSEPVVFGEEQVYLPPAREDMVTSEIADWMMLINGTEMRHYGTSNGNFLFILKGLGGTVNSMFIHARRKHIHIAEECRVEED